MEQASSNLHTPSLVKNVKQGEYVRFALNGPVWVRGSFDRTTRKYSFYAFDDINSERFAKASRSVFIGFTF